MKYKNIIPLSNPDISDLEKEDVLAVLSTSNLSLGPKLKEFEEKFAAYVGSQYAVAVNSGTSGLHLCIRSLDIKDGDEVFTSPFSFIASANCILFERATPVFVDINEETLNIDAEKLNDTVMVSQINTQRGKAIIPVHIFGLPCEMDEITEIAHSNQLEVIEDACEALGAEYCSHAGGEGNWQKVGDFGICGVFAFYPNKQITTGEGGMIVTDNEEVYRLCRSMRNQGRSEDGGWLNHERLGYNYRLSDINCALGIAQLQRIDEVLAKREAVAGLYHKKLSEIDEILLPKSGNNKRISWFVYVFRLRDKFSRADRDSVLNKLKKKGIGCSNYFSPIHLQPFYQKKFGYKIGDFPITEKVSNRTIALPFYNNLREEQIDYVCNTLKDILSKI